ncbi:MAG: C13 family peptidase [Xanthomonadales bacterium]|jgi:hypothetical protein|nr:C13 family peptidase [Xanthomonadales bacterium]
MPTTALTEFLKTLLGGLKLLLLLRPTSNLLRPALHYPALLGVLAAVSLASDYAQTTAPRVFVLDALQTLCTDGLLLWVGSLLAARLVGKPQYGFTLAVWLGSALLLWLGLLVDLLALLLRSRELLTPLAAELLLWGQITLWVLVILRALALIEAPLIRWSSAAATALLAGLNILPWLAGLSAWAWFESVQHPDAMPPPPAPIASERVLYNQPQLLDRAIRGLAAERPGHTDLYWIAFAGDGTESVFRNEVEYVERLMEQRFDARERGIVLVNHPDTIDQRPLATRTALARALRGIGRVMDPQEDLLLLFLTLHGSEDHHLVVQMPPLPLDSIDPEWLSRTLDRSGLGPQLVIVSACYSGGFLPALEADSRVVMTAARADRPSFGCGPDSDVTYFGRALLVDALNRTIDFPRAFELARRGVDARERREGFDPSEPQLSLGAVATRRIESWRAQYEEPEIVVPFFPAESYAP